MTKTPENDKNISETEQTECEFSRKVNFLFSGHICQLDRCFCNHFGKPLIFAECPTRIRELKERHQKELLETQ